MGGQTKSEAFVHCLPRSHCTQISTWKKTLEYFRIWKCFSGIEVLFLFVFIPYLLWGMLYMILGNWCITRLIVSLGNNFIPGCLPPPCLSLLKGFSEHRVTLEVNEYFRIDWGPQEVAVNRFLQRVQIQGLNTVPNILWSPIRNTSSKAKNWN